MFTNEIREDYSFVGWLTQQIGSIAVPCLVALFTGALGENIERGYGFPLGVVGKIIWYSLTVWGIGFFFALLVHRFMPRAAIEGRWVWGVPMFFFALAFVGSALLSSFGHAVSKFFYPGASGEDSWVLMLVTYPTCQAILYSLGMFIASRGSRGRLGAAAEPCPKV